MLYKALLMTLILATPLHANAIKYNDMGITDDEIASSIKPPRPTSVSLLLGDIEKKYHNKFNEIEEIDLSCNNICVKGAAQILEFAYMSLPNLKTINFSNNRIYDWRGQEDNDNFETQLERLLKRPSFESINLQINGVANLNYFNHISQKIGSTFAFKFKWKNDE